MGPCPPPPRLSQGVLLGHLTCDTGHPLRIGVLPGHFTLDTHYINPRVQNFYWFSYSLPHIQLQLYIQLCLYKLFILEHQLETITGTLWPNSDIFCTYLEIFKITAKKKKTFDLPWLRFENLLSASRVRPLRIHKHIFLGHGIFSRILNAADIYYHITVQTIIYIFSCWSESINVSMASRYLLFSYLLRCSLVTLFSFRPNTLTVKILT